MTADHDPGAPQFTLRLLDDLARLRGQYADLRMQYADLLAATRATLLAAHAGEPDALAYLTDELTAMHGQTDLPPVGWSGVDKWVMW